jgi:hypothetical protein
VAVGTGLAAAIGSVMLIFKSQKPGGRPVRVTPKQKLDEWVDFGVFSLPPISIFNGSVAAG